MTQLGEPLPSELNYLRTDTEAVLTAEGYETIDANSFTTGRDFLLKIWEMILSVPMGIALIHEDMRPSAIGNVFYELGLMQAYGKETLVVKTEAATIPSDFVRTEYIETGRRFRNELRQFLDGLSERAQYYANLAAIVENNPLLSLDYLRRAHLLSGDESYRTEAKTIFDSAALADRAKNSVEMLLVSFLE